MFGADGNAIDMATILVGIFATFVRPCRRMIRREGFTFDRSKCVVDFLNGASLVPFVIMAGSTFYTVLLNEVMKSKVSLGVAGVVGFFFIIGEVLGAGSKPAE